MMFVNSVLSVSRCEYATSCGVAVNVKLCPASSLTRPSFSLTWAAPSLLQKSAVCVRSLDVSVRGTHVEGLTRGVLVWYAYGGCFFTVLSPLEVAVCELERAR